MKVLVAVDKFKGSLSSYQACEAIRYGIAQGNSSIKLTTMPLADGGEGTAEILTKAASGGRVNCMVSDPIGRAMSAAYGIAGSGTVAYIEMAAASGLQLLKPHERNPAHTSTVGTGQVIANAISRDVSEIVLAIGGSATNDAGIGVASALGAQFRNRQGNILEPIGKNLIQIERMALDILFHRIQSIRFKVLCDVANPLIGDNGAARVFAPQKGADPSTVEQLELGMKHFHEFVYRNYGFDLNFPGAGAAGGLGAGAKFFLKAEVVSGIDYILKAIDAERLISKADLVITGEGKLDSQTMSGKVISGVADLCRQHNKPLWVVCGKNELSNEELNTLGISRMISLVDDDTSENEAMTKTSLLIRKKLEAAFGTYSGQP